VSRQRVYRTICSGEERLCAAPSLASAFEAV